MIRVLHLRSTERVCGPGKTILESCKWIDHEAFDLSIGLLSNLDASENLFWQAAIRRDAKITQILGKSRFDVGQVRFLANLIKEQNIDIIHSHEYKSDILGLIASRQAGKPIITTAHGWISNNLKSKLYLGVGKNILRWFDYVIAVSPAIEGELMRYGVRRERLALVHNAIVIEDFDPSSIAPGYVRTKLGIPDGATIIGNVGRLSPEKGQKVFIQAAEAILKQRNDVYFVLVGDGPDTDELSAYVRERGLGERILFTGFEEDIKSVFRDIDILALTSYTEGFPNVVLESLCMGVPVVAADVGGVSGIVRNEETGFLIKAGDVGACIQGITRLLDDRENARRMVQNGRRLIAERFGFKDRMLQVEKIYQEVMSKN